MVRAILFDFNGVLVDDEPLHLELFQTVLAGEDVTLTAEAYRDRYLGHDDSDCLVAVLEEAGEPASESRIARLVAQKATLYQQRVQSDGYPFIGPAVDLVRRAAAEGIMVGVVSGALHSEVEGALEQAGVRSLVKTVVAAEDVVDGKPAPEGYERALVALNSTPPLPERLLHPHQVIALEDSPAGLRAARRAGLHTVALAHTYPHERLHEDADLVVEELGSLELDELSARFD